MAFGASNLHLNPVAPGSNTYVYRTSDTLATVLGASYFDYGPNTAPRLVAEDMIYVIATDGNMWVKVSEASDTTGACTVHYLGGNLPIRTFATGTAAPLALLSVGFYEVGTSIATASRNILPTPYPGAAVKVFKVDSGTQSFSFDAGACDSDISLGASGAAAGGGTAVTYDSVGNRRITLRFEGESFHAVGSSTSRWRLMGLNYQSTGDGCASIGPQYGATNVLGAT
jgi:hypothetical protein